MEHSLIIDRESDLGRIFTVVNFVNMKATTFEQAVASYKKLSHYYDKVCRFIDSKTGETIKGPKYDTTTQDFQDEKNLKKLLEPGVKVKPVIEPTQNEPRDRIGEINSYPTGEYRSTDMEISDDKKTLWVLVHNGESAPNYHGVNVGLDVHTGRFQKFVIDPNDALARQQSVKDKQKLIYTATNAFKQAVEAQTATKPMSEITKFRKIVKECISEYNREKDPRAKLKESLRGVVQTVLKEIATSVPTKFDKDETETIQKQYNKKGNERLDKTNEKQQKELETIVHGIDPTWECYWDDHNQLVVCAQNLLYVRVCQRFENSYDVDAMVKLVDRIRAIALTWEQVKAFVKANFGDLKDETKADSLKKKALDHYEDRDVIKKAAGPNHDIIKNRGEKKNGEDAKINSNKNAIKNYNEPLTKRDEDMPDQPMKQVTEPGKDPEGKNKNIKKTEKVAAPKHKNDKKLRVDDKKTSKFREKKSD